MSVSTPKPIVSWAGPHIRATVTLRDAGEQLSMYRKEAGLKLLREHLEHINAVIDFVENHPL